MTTTNTAGDQIAELHRRVTSGRATTAELESYFGPTLLAQVAHQSQGTTTTRRHFEPWFTEVMEPLGIESDPAWKLFTGQISSQELAEGLTETQLDAFLEGFEDLQRTYSERHHPMRTTGTTGSPR